MENLRIDENSRWVLGAVANDGSGDIKNARVNPITGALIVEATVTSTNTQIGSTIPGGTAGSVLFLGLGGTLAQDNTNFFYDDTNNYLGIGTSTPNATLDVQGTAIITGSAGTPTFVLGRDGSGNISNIVLGSNLTLTGGVLSANTSGSGYNQIQDNGTNITQRTTLNFVDYFTVTDGSSKTNVSINTAELGADATLISTLETNLDLANISGQINLATQVTGILSPTNIDITNLESTLDLGNIAGQIDLTTQVTGLLSPTNIDVVALANDATFISNLEPNLNLANLGGQIDLASQVTGVLPLANGGTGQSLTDPNYNAVYVWDNTTNTTRLAQLSGLSYNSGTNTLTANSSAYAGGVGFVEMIPTINTVQPITSSTFISTDPTLTTTDNIYISECSPSFGSPGGVNITIYKYSKKPQGYFTYDGSFGTFNCSSVTFGGGTNNPMFLNRPHIYQGNIYVPVINFGGTGNSFLFYVIDGTTGTFIGLTNSIIPTGSWSYPSGVNATAYADMYYNTAFTGGVITWKIQINSTSSITLVNTYTNPYVGAYPNGIKLQANNYCYDGVTLYDITAATGVVYDAGYPYMSGNFSAGAMNTVIDNNMALIATESLTGTTLTVNKFYIVPNVGGSPF